MNQNSINNDTSHTKGIGLGLYICKKLCEKFDGNIKLIYSSIDQGSSFEFTFGTQG